MNDPSLPFRRGSGLLLLIDPDRAAGEQYVPLARHADTSGAAGVLIGTSFDGSGRTDEIVRALKAGVPGLPVALFPGSASQLSPSADLVLLLSLVSGRNPQYLIEEHVRSAPFFQRHRVPALSTAYVLVDGGRVTAVEAVSQTRPLPADKPELVEAHVVAARMIGMRAVFLDTGSGADRPVPAALIAAARRAAPGGVIFVGGGIRSPEAAAHARAAGADFVVVGTEFERAGPARMREFTAAVPS